MNTPTNRKLLVLFIFLVSVALILGVRNELNGRDIKDNTEKIEQLRIDAEYNDCLSSIPFIENFNAAHTRLAELERLLKTGDPETDEVREQRAKEFQALLIPVPKCVKPGK